jgi:hypothetical protein
MAPLRKSIRLPALPLTPSSVVRSRSVRTVLSASAPCLQPRAARSRSVSNCVIMDTATIRGLKRNPMRIGDNVLVGPRAYLTGCEVEDNAFLATGATVFNGARIGARATVRINGIVHIRTALPPDAVVPLNWIAVGDPVEILPSSVSRGGHPSGKLCPRSCHATRVPFKHIGRIGYCSGLNVEKAEALRL